MGQVDTGGGVPRWRPSWRVVVSVVGVSLIYATLRLSLNEAYKYADWRTLVEFRAPLPFGHRVLMPVLTHGLHRLGIPWVPSIWLLEVLATVALVVALRFAITGLHARFAWAHAVAFVYVLALAYLVPHKWPIFYPWDTPAMAAVAAGVGFGVRGQFARATVLTGVAALNRESAILIPAVAIVLQAHRSSFEIRRGLAWAGLMMVTFWAVRGGVGIAWPDAPGPPLHFTVGERYRLFENIGWLAQPRHWAPFIAGLGLLPLLFCVAARFSVPHYRRLHGLAVATGCGLMIVGNVHEPRAWGEVLVLLWLPIASALPLWIAPRQRVDHEGGPRWLRMVDHFGAFALVAALLLFALALRRWSFLPIAQWPMPGL